MATLREDPYGPFNFRVTISPASGGEFRGKVATQHDIGTAPGHIGGNRHRSRLSGLGDNFGLHLVVLGI